MAIGRPGGSGHEGTPWCGCRGPHRWASHAPQSMSESHHQVVGLHSVGQSSHGHR